MEEAPVAREEKGPVSVLTMQYRPYNLLGPRLLGAIANEIAAARDAGSRAIILRSGLRHFSAGADVAQFTARARKKARISRADASMAAVPPSRVCADCQSSFGSDSCVMPC